MTDDERRRYAENLVADWPPLTAEQRDRLAGLMRTESATKQPRIEKKAAA